MTRRRDLLHLFQHQTAGILQQSKYESSSVLLFLQIVFSPLFIMRSHLPDPIIIHLEKRSLGLSETQIIPGKGKEKPLQNIEPDLIHHLTFQARYWKNLYIFLREIQQKSSLVLLRRKEDRVFGMRMLFLNCPALCSLIFFCNFK